MESIRGGQIAFDLFNELNECIFCSTSLDQSEPQTELAKGIYSFECPIKLNILRPGKYRIQISSSVPGKEILDIIDEPLVFDLIDDLSPILKLGQNRRGIIFNILPWRLIIEET